MPGFVGHLEEEQEGELLQIIAIRQTVVTEDGAVFPELLDDGGWVRHMAIPNRPDLRDVAQTTPDLRVYDKPPEGGRHEVTSPSEDSTRAPSKRLYLRCWLVRE